MDTVRVHDSGTGIAPGSIRDHKLEASGRFEALFSSDKNASKRIREQTLDASLCFEAQTGKISNASICFEAFSGTDLKASGRFEALFSSYKNASKRIREQTLDAS